MVVNFYGSLRMLTGTKSLVVDLPEGSDLAALLKEVLWRFPALHDELFDEQGRLRDSLPLFLNGCNPRLLPEPLKAPLRTDDILSLFSPVSSGRINVEVLRQPTPERRKGGNES